MLEEMTFTKYRTQGVIQKERKEKCGLTQGKPSSDGTLTQSKIKAASIKIEARPITEQPNAL